MVQLLTEEDLKKYDSLILAIHLSEGVEAIEFDKSDVETFKKVSTYLHSIKNFFDDLGGIILPPRSIEEILDYLYVLVGSKVLDNLPRFKIRGEEVATGNRKGRK